MLKRISPIKLKAIWIFGDIELKAILNFDFFVSIQFERDVEFWSDSLVKGFHIKLNYLFLSELFFVRFGFKGISAIKLKANSQFWKSHFIFSQLRRKLSKSTLLGDTQFFFYIKKSTRFCITRFVEFLKSTWLVYSVTRFFSKSTRLRLSRLLHFLKVFSLRLNL